MIFSSEPEGFSLQQLQEDLADLRDSLEKNSVRHIVAIGAVSDSCLRPGEQFRC